MDYNKNYADRYRVKSPIRTFRDLEVYQKTIQLSNKLLSLPFLNTPEYQKDKEELKLLAENTPKLIAEAWSDKFDSRELARKKLTHSLSLITNIITKLDLLRERFKDAQTEKESLDQLLLNYQYQKRKVLNLRRAWDRVFSDNASISQQH